MKLLIFIMIIAGSIGVCGAQDLRIVDEKAPGRAPLVEIKEHEYLPPVPPMAEIRLTEKDLQYIYQYMSEIDPEGAKRLKDLQLKDKYHFDRQMQHLYREVMFLKRLKLEEPERYQESIKLRKLSRESGNLAESYRKSTDESEKEKIKQELRPILGRLFDLREKEKQAEIKRIKEHLVRLQNKIAERNINKQLIIQNRLDQLTGKGNLYEW
jgi:Rad3-related DNA helicase